jgi:hypothetical protein
MEEYAFESGICVWRCPFCMEMVDADILQLSSLSSFAEGIDEYLRGACYAAKMNVVS